MNVLGTFMALPIFGISPTCPFPWNTTLTNYIYIDDDTHCPAGAVRVR